MSFFKFRLASRNSTLQVGTSEYKSGIPRHKLEFLDTSWNFKFKLYEGVEGPPKIVFLIP